MTGIKIYFSVIVSKAKQSRSQHYELQDYHPGINRLG